MLPILTSGSPQARTDTIPRHSSSRFRTTIAAFNAVDAPWDLIQKKRDSALFRRLPLSFAERVDLVSSDRLCLLPLQARQYAVDIRSSHQSHH
jgi:hypothetical protein